MRRTSPSRVAGPNRVKTLTPQAQVRKTANRCQAPSERLGGGALGSTERLPLIGLRFSLMKQRDCDAIGSAEYRIYLDGTIIAKRSRACSAFHASTVITNGLSRGSRFAQQLVEEMFSLRFNPAYATLGAQRHGPFNGQVNGELQYKVTQPNRELAAPDRSLVPSRGVGLENETHQAEPKHATAPSQKKKKKYPAIDYKYLLFWVVA